jgi:hypothetical protein
MTVPDIKTKSLMFPNSQEFALKVTPDNEPPTVLFIEAATVAPASQKVSEVKTVSAKKNIPQYDPAGGVADAPV